MIHLALVEEVLPALPGLRVRFQDLVRSGFASSDYVRVCFPRMSGDKGASQDLPVKGELVALAEMTNGYYLCMGSVPMSDKNQVDPTPGLAFWKHDSGVTVQARANGDTEFAHPSGLKFTLSRDGNALPDLQASSAPAAGEAVVPVLTISHPAGPSVVIDADGNAALKGFASMAFQDGDKRFSMEGLPDWLFGAFKTWLNGHVHTSASPGSPTTAPVTPLETPAKDTVCSPASFVGPQGA